MNTNTETGAAFILVDWLLGRLINEQRLTTEDAQAFRREISLALGLDTPLPQREPTGPKDMALEPQERLILVVILTSILTPILTSIMVTVIVTCDHVVIHILQHHEKIGAGGMKLRSQLLGTAGELFGLVDVFSETAAAGLRTGRQL